MNVTQASAVRCMAAARRVWVCLYVGGCLYRIYEYVV